MPDHIAVLSGAGMSAESGLQTFRDSGGLWEGHDVMEVASPEGWRRNRNLVLEFYNQRRRQLFEVEPNEGHLSLVRLESKYQVDIITQNVDDLHERAGSSNVLHLHGELMKARSEKNPNLIIPWERDILPTDIANDGYPLRPHIVWFGEAVPMIEKAAYKVSLAKKIIIIGTSMQVYPAASLVGFARPDVEIYYVDPKPSISYELQKLPQLEIIEDTASSALPTLVNHLLR